MKKLSIVGKDYHTEEHVVGYYTTGDRMMYWGKLGAFWGGFWGLLFGSAFFWVPGIGQLLVAGPLVMWIVGALEEAAVTGGLSALGAGLYSIGIPKNSVLQYETEVKNGKLLLVAHGTPDEVERAKDLLDQTEASSTDGSCRAGRRRRVTASHGDRTTTSPERTRDQYQSGRPGSLRKPDRSNAQEILHDVHATLGRRPPFSPSPNRRKSSRLSSTGIPRCSTGGRSGWRDTSWPC